MHCRLCLIMTKDSKYSCNTSKYMCLFSWTISLQRCQTVSLWWKMLLFRLFILIQDKIKCWSIQSSMWNGNFIFQPALQRLVRSRRPWPFTCKSIPGTMLLTVFCSLVRFLQPVFLVSWCCKCDYLISFNWNIQRHSHDINPYTLSNTKRTIKWKISWESFLT